MYVYYREKTGEVVMQSDKHMNCPGLICKKVTPTKSQREKIEQNHRIFIKNNKLEIQETQLEVKKRTVEKLKKDIKKANSVGELKEIINSLLDNQ